MYQKPMVIPDAADRDEYEKLVEIVKGWIATRDKSLIFRALNELLERSRSSYISCVYDRGSTDTDFRRHGRYQAQACVLAAAFAGGDEAKTAYMLANYPTAHATRSLVEGLASIALDDAAIDRPSTITRIVEKVSEKSQCYVSLKKNISPEISFFGVYRDNTPDMHESSHAILVKDENGDVGTHLIFDAFVINTKNAPKHLLLICGKTRDEQRTFFEVEHDNSVLEVLIQWMSDASGRDLSGEGAFSRHHVQDRNPSPPRPPRLVSLDSKKRVRDADVGIDFPHPVELPYRGPAIVGFFDLLGFSAYLERNWPEQPENTLGDIRRDLEAMGTSTFAGRPFPEVRMISDSFIAFVPCELDEEGPIYGFLTIASLAHRLASVSARRGFCIRGAIDLGEVYCDAYDITGPGLARVVKLEGLAEGVRTIIGPSLLNAVADNASNLRKSKIHTTEYAGRTIHQKSVPLGDTFFGALRKSPDGLMRLGYDIGLVAQLRKLHAGAPSEKTRRKFTEFIAFADSGRIEPQLLSRPTPPAREIRRQMARVRKRLLI